MARKKLKDIKFPDLPDTYYVPEIDATLSTEGATADAKAVGDALDLKPDKTELEEAIDDLDERKAEIDGCYEGLTSGMAMGLVTDSVVEDKEPYTYRSLANLNVGRFCEDTLVGGSIVWNQLADSGALEVTVPNGHKYYANINGTKSIGASTGTAISINDSTEDNVIDLTAAVTPLIADYIYSLEQTTAGAGVAWFKKYFPKEYLEYCEPHFEHVQVSAKNTVGFNQFDKSDSANWKNWSVGSGGAISVNSSMKSAILPCLPNTQYYAGKTKGGRIGLASFPSYPTSSDIATRAGLNLQGTYVRITTGANDHYLVVWFYNANVDTAVSAQAVADTLCLNISGDRDGEYEAYRKRTYPLDSSLTLRGIPKLDSANRLYFDGDIYRHDGSGEYRYGLVDLGTLNYAKVVSSSITYFTAYRPNDMAFAAGNIMPNLFCPLYTPVSFSGTWNDKNMSFDGSSSHKLTLINNDYTDVASFKTAMSGVYLLYEKATPEPFTAEPFQSPMVVDPLGTEEFVDYAVEQGERDVAIPVGHDSNYPEDLVKKTEKLPSPTGTNGDYLITEVDGKLYLKPYVPAVGLTAPTSEGEGE